MSSSIVVGLALYALSRLTPSQCLAVARLHPPLIATTWDYFGSSTACLELLVGQGADASIYLSPIHSSSISDLSRRTRAFYRFASRFPSTRFLVAPALEDMYPWGTWLKARRILERSRPPNVELTRSSIRVYSIPGVLSEAHGLSSTSPILSNDGFDLSVYGCKKLLDGLARSQNTQFYLLWWGSIQGLYSYADRFKPFSKRHYSTSQLRSAFSCMKLLSKIRKT